MSFILNVHIRKPLNKDKEYFNINNIQNKEEVEYIDPPKEIISSSITNNNLTDIDSSIFSITILRELFKDDNAQFRSSQQ